ncbi:MAG: hypothetical protein GY870_08350 [archaeon]|nr:hypothetical protein [archaeon]
MEYFVTLSSGRGTKLYQNSIKNQKIFLNYDNNDEKCDLSKILVIIGKKIGFLNKYINSNKKIQLNVEKNQEYMIINLNDNDLICNFLENPSNHITLYNPYLYEKEEHATLDPEVFKKNFTNKLIPDDYIDTLAKWYSIKYTYNNYNLIFLKPGVGISFQTHELREEFWEVIYGSPIIISGDEVIYNTQKGDKTNHKSGSKGLHSLINPGREQWIAIKETYNGTFDEEDIIRMFNPNQYR